MEDPFKTRDKWGFKKWIQQSVSEFIGRWTTAENIYCDLQWWEYTSFQGSMGRGVGVIIGSY